MSPSFFFFFLFFFFRAFRPDDSCMTLVCPLVQCNSKNDFGSGISWVLIKFQGEIRLHISHLGFWWSGRWWDFSPERNSLPLISFFFFLALLHFLMLQRHSFKIKSLLCSTEACGGSFGGSCLMCSVGILYLLDWFIAMFHVFSFFFHLIFTKSVLQDTTIIKTINKQIYGGSSFCSWLQQRSPKSREEKQFETLQMYFIRHFKRL